VDLVDYSFEDLNTKLQLALSAGDPPDLAYVTPRGPGIPAYVGAHRLRDLTSLARSHGWASKLQPGLLAAYNQPFAFFGARAGHVVAVPTSLAAVGILYNKRLLQRLHLGVPRSLAALESALARAKAAGYTPIGMGNADGWLGDDWYQTIVNSQVPPTSLQSEQRISHAFSFRRSPFLQAARLLERWSRRGYFTHDFGGLDAQEGVDLFFHGSTLFQLVSSSENAQILQDDEQTGLPLSGYEGWVVPSTGRHPQEAISFIDYLLAPATARFLLRQGLLPAHNVGRDALVASPAVRKRPWQREYLQSLGAAQPGIYLDAAPVANLNATMEANVQLLLQGYETPQFLVNALQKVYRGGASSAPRIDGEF
jgi:raffinose/stachyose/melibiose transport system substrate-binding protein